VIGDKEKRAQYDRGEIDEAGQPQGFNPGAQHPGGFGQGWEGFRRQQQQGGRGAEFNWSNEQGGGFSAEDIFADIFGGMGGGGARSRRSQPRKGADVQFQTTVSLEEAALGGSRRVAIDDKQLDVRIPPGVKDGQQIRLRGQGQPGDRGGPPGDALITITIAPHPYLQRDGRDLKMDLPITLKEAIDGAKVEVPTLDGAVTLTVPANSNSFRMLRLKGKGLPGSGTEPGGDLYVRLIVTLPEQPDPKLTAALKGWDAHYNPRDKLK
jgi:DnaJ-class molecular chaperone